MARANRARKPDKLVKPHKKDQPVIVMGRAIGVCDGFDVVNPHMDRFINFRPTAQAIVAGLRPTPFLTIDSVDGEFRGCDERDNDTGFMKVVIHELFGRPM